MLGYNTRSTLMDILMAISYWSYDIQCLTPPIIFVALRWVSERTGQVPQPEDNSRMNMLKTANNNARFSKTLRQELVPFYVYRRLGRETTLTAPTTSTSTTRRQAKW